MKRKTEPVNTQDIYTRAVDKYGKDAQLLMVAEECCELALEIHHHNRGRNNREALLGELADVTIMIDQACHILGIPENELQSAVTAKLNRFSRRLRSQD